MRKILHIGLTMEIILIIPSIKFHCLAHKEKKELSLMNVEIFLFIIFFYSRLFSYGTPTFFENPRKIYKDHVFK